MLSLIDQSALFPSFRPHQCLQASGLDTLYFTCSAVLIILAWRLTKIKITWSAFSADFKPKG
jgi:hypothetical protein